MPTKPTRTTTTFSTSSSTANLSISIGKLAPEPAKVTRVGPVGHW